MQAKQPRNKALMVSSHQARPGNRRRHYMLDSLESCAQMTMVRGQDQCMGFDCQSMKLFEGARGGSAGSRSKEVCKGEADLKGGVTGIVSQAAWALWQPCRYSRFTCTSTLLEGCVQAALGEENAAISSAPALP